MIAKPICIPRISPPGYEYRQEEPTYDQERHLALEKPEKIYQLADLGYEETVIATCPSSLAITSKKAPAIT